MSSLGYAERLSYREDLGGQLGAPEKFDAGPVEADPRVQELIRLVREAEVRAPAREPKPGLVPRWLNLWDALLAAGT